MINGLIKSLARFSRDAAILIAGIYVFVWAFKQINPAYLLEKSEAKQIAYVDNRIMEKERLDEQRHQETMKAVSRLEARSDRIEEKIDRLSPRGRATI